MSTVKRDRWDRPLIVPPGGGDPVPYSRASSYGDVLDDVTNLRKWEQRHVALGVVDRPDIALKVAENREDKAALNKVCDEAKEAAGTNVSSSIGTSLHALTERIDKGEEVPTLPAPYQGSIEAFRSSTQLLTPVSIERFLVNDYLGVAGTTDRIYQIGNRELLTIGDTKTGMSLDFGIAKIAVQLAIYSRSQGYDTDTGERTELGIDQDWGLIVHLPAGKGTCELLWIDLQAGWSLALLAQDVRDARKLGKKNLVKPVDFEELIG